MSVASGGPGAIYCERWDRVGHTAHVPLDDEQARQRFAAGPWFSVVLPYQPPDGALPRPDAVAAAPDTVLEIEAGLTTVTAVFFDDDTGGVVAEYVFRRDGDVLLLAEGIQYEAPDDGRRGLSAVTRTRQLWLQADGTLDVIVDERDGEGIEYVDDATADVATYTEPVPAFGDWVGLARFER